MPVYLFSTEGLAALAKYISPDTLFVFDLDGTLAPIVEDFSAAQIDPLVRTTLERLIKFANVAVITGRSREDALRILGFEPHLLVGNHGAEWPSDSSSTFAQCSTNWYQTLQQELGDVQGVELEFKGASLSVHYRKALNQANTLMQIDNAIKHLEPEPKRIAGKFVVNLLPMEALTKGEALVEAMNRFGLERAVFFGDDVTDEEVFILKNIDLFGVHIGKDQKTAAAFNLKKQIEMLGLLNSIVGIFELRNEKTA